MFKVKKINLGSCCWEKYLVIGERYLVTEEILT
jgi:hypothetical protein